MSLERARHDEAIELRDSFVYLFDQMVRNHLQFDLVSESDFDMADVGDGYITIGNFRYMNVIIPKLVYIRQTTLEVIKKMLKKGCFAASHGDNHISDTIAFSIDDDANKGFYNNNLDNILGSLKKSLKISGYASDEIILKHHADDDKDIKVPVNGHNLSERINTDPVWSFLKEKRNVLILDRWLMKKTDGDCSMKELTTYGWENISTFDLSCKDEDTTNETVWYRTVFNAQGGIKQAALILEDSSIDGEYEIYFNGSLLKSKKRIREFDCMNIEYLIKDVINVEEDRRFYTPGANVIALKVRGGKGLREPLRLFGRFRVYTKEESSLYASIRGLSGKDSISIGD